MARYTAPVIPRPAGDGWELVPSVMTGGAPSFWHRRTADGLEWVSYDRIARAWYRTVEPFAAGAETTREVIA